MHGADRSRRDPPERGGGAVVAPARGGGLTGGELLGESWAQGNYSNDPNPLFRQAIRELTITVDDGETVSVVSRRFELISPQMTVQLPPDNVFGVPAQATTFTAHAWGAVVRRLRPGRHIVTFRLVAPDFGGALTATITLNVVRGGHSNTGDHDDRA